MKDLILKAFKEIEKSKRELIELCRNLTKIETTSNPPLKIGKEKEGQEYIAKKLAEIGFKDILTFEPDEGKLSKLKGYVPAPDWKERYNGRHNVVGVLGRDSGRSLILNGHIDTVTPGPIELWQHRPFSAEIEDGKIYGRGSCDMKGGLAATLTALRIARELQGIQGKVIFESVVDEEGGGNGSLACATEGYSADAAVVAEPTNLKICCAHRGVLISRIEVYGKAAHASEKYEGVSALDKGVEILRELSSLEQWRRDHVEPHPLLEKPTILAGKFQAGDQVNIVPPKATIDIDVKYLPSEIDEEGAGSKVKGQIVDWILKESEKDPWLKLTPPKIEFLYDLPPSSIPADHPLISALNTVYSLLFGGQSTEVIGFQAWSDMYHLNSHGTPAIMFGPGDMKYAHQTDEYIDIQQLIDATKVLCGLIISWCR